MTVRTRRTARLVAVLAVALGGAGCGDDEGTGGTGGEESALCRVTDEFNARVYDTGSELRDGYIELFEGLLATEALDDDSAALATEALDEVRGIEPTSPDAGVNAYVATLGPDSAAVAFSNDVAPQLAEDC